MSDISRDTSERRANCKERCDLVGNILLISNISRASYRNILSLMRRHNKVIEISISRSLFRVWLLCRVAANDLNAASNNIPTKTGEVFKCVSL